MLEIFKWVSMNGLDEMMEKEPFEYKN